MTRVKAQAVVEPGLLRELHEIAGIGILSTAINRKATGLRPEESVPRAAEVSWVRAGEGPARVR
jgi:hypothetical protein